MLQGILKWENKYCVSSHTVQVTYVITLMFGNIICDC